MPGSEVANLHGDLQTLRAMGCDRADDVDGGFVRGGDERRWRPALPVDRQRMRVANQILGHHLLGVGSARQEGGGGKEGGEEA